MSLPSLKAGLVLGLLLLSGPGLFAQNKIATIDLKRVFDGYWKTQQADGSLREKAAEFEKKNKLMVEDYQKATEEYKRFSTAPTTPLSQSRRRTSARKPPKPSSSRSMKSSRASNSSSAPPAPRSASNSA